MALIADANGRISGSFTTPANLPVGRKLVEFSGSGGSRGIAAYYAEHIARAVTVRQEFATLYGDPLAQTFTPNRNMVIGGVDLWVGDVGSSPIAVQIRETQVGFPTNVTLAVGRLNPAEITVGAMNRFEFPPIRLSANVEYAFVVMCDDPIGAIGTAQMGKWDGAAGRWVTAQPYSVGVMLSSSNASTWTAHQDQDLTFQLLETVFVAGQQTFDLGTVAVSGATDFLLSALVDVLGANCGIAFDLIMPSGGTYRLSAGQVLSLSSPETGDVGVRAVLTATASSAPVLLPGVQIFHGVTSSAATYVTRVMPAGNPSIVTVTFEAHTPGASSIVAECQPSDGGAVWTPVPLSSGVPVGDGWEELTHKLAGFSGADVRVRLTLTGSAAERPRARNLRVIVT